MRGKVDADAESERMRERNRKLGPIRMISEDSTANDAHVRIIQKRNTWLRFGAAIVRHFLSFSMINLICRIEQL
jgi:hypothetical protein